MKRIGAFYLLLFTFIFSIAISAPTSDIFSIKTYAVFKTSMGDITCELYPDKAPITVRNFIGLATGTQMWISPTSGAKMLNIPLYSNTIFHRVIPGFMIQGGDPLANGRGGPGYRFNDEFSADLEHDRPGRLSMANSGPNTNGSQFFITHIPTQWLDGKHTVFGQVVEGMDIVKKIGAVKRDRFDSPVVPVVLKEIQIINK